MGTIAKLYEIKYAIVNVTTAVEVWEKNLIDNIKYPKEISPDDWKKPIKSLL